MTKDERMEAFFLAVFFFFFFCYEHCLTSVHALCTPDKIRHHGDLVYNENDRQSWADRLVTRYFDALTAERARCDEEATAAASTSSSTVPVPAGSDRAEGTRESARRPLPPAAVAASARL